MNVIKYKGYCGDQVVYGFPYIEDGVSYIIENGKYHVVDKLFQYINKNDRHGVEIYEGDKAGILDLCDYRTGVIVYSKTLSQFRLLDEDGYMFDIHNCEIEILK